MGVMKMSSYLINGHQSRQELLTWINALDLDYSKAIDSFDHVKNGEILCLILNQLFPIELRKRHIERDAVLTYDRRKNYKLIKRIAIKYNICSNDQKFEELAENTSKSSSITQLVELTSRIRDFYMANCYILQQNRENERIKQEESKEREQVIKILSNERDEYFTKLRMIEDELAAMKKLNLSLKKPMDRNEKLVLDRINSILSD